MAHAQQDRHPIPIQLTREQPHEDWVLTTGHRGCTFSVSQTRTGETPDADGAANADGESAQAPTLSAFGYLSRVAGGKLGAVVARVRDGGLRLRRGKMYIGIGTVVVLILILILLRVFGVI
jgi:hypothetical protein